MRGTRIQSVVNRQDDLGIVKTVSRGKPTGSFFADRGGDFSRSQTKIDSLPEVAQAGLAGTNHLPRRASKDPKGSGDQLGVSPS